ncbi:MAG: hypothetical protein KAJ19_28395 [Gammaproteobacteria bacterium]|nr:hypothetical protein [Gammaproteobacteria bacterium]
MDNLAPILDQLLAEKPREPMPQAERDVRAVVIGALFEIKGAAQEVDRQKQYLDETAPIPLQILVIAIKLLIRAHPYPHVPAPADIWQAAREVARMDREQCIPPAGCSQCSYAYPREWPPDGMRYGAVRGEFKALPEAACKLLTDPRGAALYLGTGSRDA